jgi:hypothetical protein
VSEQITPPIVASGAGPQRWRANREKALFAAGFLAIATSTASAQVYVYPSAPYGYGAGYYAVPYVPQPFVGYYGYYSYYSFDPTANNWDYYRTDSPGRGFDAESTR